MFRRPGEDRELALQIVTAFLKHLSQEERGESTSFDDDDKSEDKEEEETEED